MEPHPEKRRRIPDSVVIELSILLDLFRYFMQVFHDHVFPRVFH